MFGGSQKKSDRERDVPNFLHPFWSLVNLLKIERKAFVHLEHFSLRFQTHLKKSLLLNRNFNSRTIRFDSFWFDRLKEKAVFSLIESAQIPCSHVWDKCCGHWMIEQTSYFVKAVILETFHSFDQGERKHSGTRLNKVVFVEISNTVSC